MTTTGPHDFIVGRPSRGRPTMLTPELREELCAHLAQGAPIKTACQAVGISKATYYSWRTRGKKARDEPPPTLKLTRQGLIDLLTEANVTYPARATKTVLLELLTRHRQGPYLDFLDSSTRAGAIRTLASLARIEARSGGRNAYRAHNYDTHREERHHHHYGAGAVHAAGLAR